MREHAIAELSVSIFTIDTTKLHVRLLADKGLSTEKQINGIEILTGDCRETLKTLPDNSVHCVVTSPPYFGLRDYGCDGQIGLEATPDEFVAEMVAVFREVRRVLRDDGTVWINLGDSYSNAGTRQGDRDGGVSAGSTNDHRIVNGGYRPRVAGLKNKDLVGIPWMVAFALRADGWWLRQDIIWHKPNPMPESVTDRCTKAHEYLFLLTKSARYFFDAAAIQETAACGNNGSEFNTGKTGEHQLGRSQKVRPSKPKGSFNGKTEAMAETGQNAFRAVTETRNKRSVWTVSTKSYKGAHFATFPPDLIEPCILAGTSEHGCCPQCGAPWERIIETTFIPQQDVCEEKRNKGLDETSGLSDTPRGSNSTKTIGWQPACQCGPELEPVPCTVLDPFNGSGTTGEVARNCGCHYIGCELNPDYVQLTKKRLKQGSLLV